MLLAIDAGNTNTVFALFDGKTLAGVWRTTTSVQHTTDEYAVFLKTLMAEAGLKPKKVSAAILGSVVPDANFHLVNLCAKHFNCTPLVVGAPDVTLGIKVHIDRPEEVGADRLVNAISGALTHKPPLLIIDFGTATTFDVVDANGDYCGGAIAPGINLSLQALHMAAAKLPRVGVARPQKVIGTNTVEAIKSGTFWGYTGLIEGMIERIKTEFGQPMTVIATGGLAPLFRDVLPAIEHIDADLTLRGLQAIYERNSAKTS
jgi:type III pantothenate kinase